LLGVYADSYSPEFREKFLNTPMREIINMDRNAMLSSDYLNEFSENGHNFVAGNYRIVGKRV
jgi:hypothetical protein